MQIVMLWIKKYWNLALLLLLPLGAFLMRLSGARSASRKIEHEITRKRLEHATQVMAKDKEIELEHDKRTEELVDELEKNSTSSELSDPNSW